MGKWTDEWINGQVSGGAKKLQVNISAHIVEINQKITWLYYIYWHITC